ncbi:hypothetical protein L519_4607 [Bordetella bronchiseptica MBORD678]|uniref:Uncharacterized protein n=1 Tax=Bordetella bronchiseptica 00-P-2796 TaxID=1331199 RepID=A0ABR4RLT8_BORBO|nr:hypothetical protein L530_4729 [Bordetella bronchiseptica MO211]KCV38737.1 hypothetical protein L490_4501 [Bordetella bronchiseptica 00-P-2796]KCV42000.1 hypothetical protein L572_4824 [Bordetella bronchiseptica 345]KCV48485.1 hypothetical protein L491_4800 [Bordetella bronchiseptica 3E44]KCV65295.1 hypothetical protein AZ14_4883 [Bordetella bronchiseptica 980]KDB60659.1 hypothetical protein AZ16_4722 [Bordetella bronchiseptica B18-5 (C3)]KDB69283.1 hypothetical protein AZ15_4873 [Bordetel
MAGRRTVIVDNGTHVAPPGTWRRHRPGLCCRARRQGGGREPDRLQRSVVRLMAPLRHRKHTASMVFDAAP